MIYIEDRNANRDCSESTLFGRASSAGEACRASSCTSPLANAVGSGTKKDDELAAETRVLSMRGSSKLAEGDREDPRRR